MPKETIIRATETGWKTEARRLVRERAKFEVIPPTAEAIGECVDLSLEFNYFLVQERSDPAAHRLIMMPKEVTGASSDGPNGAAGV